MANLYQWACTDCGHVFRARAWEADCERCHSPQTYQIGEPPTYAQRDDPFYGDYLDDVPTHLATSCRGVDRTGIAGQP